MTFYSVWTTKARRIGSLSTFRKHLKTTVLSAALLTAVSARKWAQQYINADVSMTSDVEAVRASWLTDRNDTFR
ncbi:hypothetical protein [Rhizobium mongolense]|uniref:Uncharacterized protein n=2 Tax=Rhizobium mongolense TaxID=57676 RepID=A0ABR6IYV8_9HYPH|nr:hypothetical protein [Rhizobium mongolense]MBB4233112.1 hypothetical protein [Rhizobium mongolense]TVZ75246.1 hypothetical protein BCL32_0708 [Rhizobium mongolense USDA 1844]